MIGQYACLLVLCRKLQLLGLVVEVSDEIRMVNTLFDIGAGQQRGRVL